jgi:hypothetical protein
MTRPRDIEPVRLPDTDAYGAQLRRQLAEAREQLAELHGRPAVDEPTTTPRRRQPSRGVGPIGVGMPAALHLDAFGREINDAFGHLPMLVGSSATSKQWRDVDVRLILPDDEFDALFPDGSGEQGRALWGLMCAALSELAKQRTGLPVDFQIQRMSDANRRYSEEHVRWAIGLYVAGGR